MIKLDSGTLRGDYTSFGTVTTDCATVGRFITEAAAQFKNVDFNIDGRSALKIEGGGGEFVSSDYRLIEEIRYVETPSPTGYTEFYIKTKPAPKFETHEGWVKVWRGHDGIVYCGDLIFRSKQEVVSYIRANNIKVIDIVKIEWKEAIK